MTQRARADHEQHMILAILIGLPGLIAFMLTLPDPQSKPRDAVALVGTATNTGETTSNVLQFPAAPERLPAADVAHLEETA